MEFINPDENDNKGIEDRRGSSGKKVAIGGIGSVVIIIIALIMGKNPSQLLNQVNNVVPQQQSEQSDQPYKESESETAQRKIAENVYRSCKTVWTSQLQQMGKSYQDPDFVMYTGSTSTACGQGEKAMGPFYCPGDQKIYIDLSFFDELAQRFNAAGDFARAYVVAHEFGHHIQNLLGYSQKLDNARGRVSDADYNKLSVKLELQADFLAGYWAHYAQDLQKNGIKINSSDVETALNAASQIGDDKLQKEAQGYVVPDAFTHGTSAQRVEWFKKGLESGDLKQGDTFNSPELN
ncbi:KPN_02809 family neutral zinc metallopeptidase [Rhizosphaericola mali]|uniref:Metalloprotease n=1 Tax=Rhizosphaericola mali TaxID=2545455 RepID=A0A5P2G620_9BACT|nr:neutral zinc metallopeptidase [Rhizosphaericola mali]QES89332.1 metalloprotease [Rhizosphaericola mali]